MLQCSILNRMYYRNISTSTKCRYIAHYYFAILAPSLLIIHPTLKEKLSLSQEWILNVQVIEL